ncbi:hypothetical protein [Pseudomonas sp. WC2]|uniref:hypothetical protein n=1 Tax=Pseudomonas sp. WC2 TaxID=3424773 RepID=UPI003D3521D5
MTTHEVEFYYRASHPISACKQTVALPAVTIDSLNDDVLDPSLTKVLVRVAAYPDMACGDQLLLSWDGLDIEGFAYQHEMVRFVSEAQVGKELVFVVKSLHLAALDGGSLEVYWTLLKANLPQSLESERLQLSVGDVRKNLLAPQIENAVGGSLDPERVPEGTLVSLQPYARMSAGDRVLLSWKSDASVEAFNDTLKVEAFAVAEALSFWIPPPCIEANRGLAVTVTYRVERAGGEVETSDPTKVFIGPLVRGELAPPQVLEAPDGVLSVADSTAGVTLVISDAQTQEGELVYLRCDGELFSHRDDRDISAETAGRPLIFVVPHSFWREHQGSTVDITYSVERLDDVSQESAETRIRIDA